jgi:hypothetical protein
MIAIQQRYCARKMRAEAIYRLIQESSSVVGARRLDKASS